jgi:Sulfotransferase domain.
MPSNPTTDVPVGNPHGPRVVFLIGAPRSGTTWLQSLLGSHREVVTPQETDLFATFIAPLQTWWDEQVGRSDSEQRERRMKGLPAVIDDAEFTALLAGFIDHVLDAIRELDPAATVIVEKSPAHSRHTELIAKYLPDAAFVHIVRDGRDVAASLQSAAKGWGSYWVSGGMKSAARSWRTSVLSARRAATTGNYTEVRYEQLRGGDPEPLQRAFAACGLEVDLARCAELLEEFSLQRMTDGSAASPIALGGEMSQRHDGVDEPKGFFGRGKVGGWSESWTDEDRLLFDAVAGDLLVELGYEPDHAWAGTAGRRFRYARRVGALRLVGKLGRRVGSRSQRLLARLP